MGGRGKGGVANNFVTDGRLRSVFSVTETKVEQHQPILNATTLNEATEIRFTVPPSTDYFTR